MADSGEDSSQAWRPSCGLAALNARSHLYAVLRRFLAERGVMEVQTPLLGAATVTDTAIDSFRVHDDGQQRYLQTSPEYFLKRLLAAGAPSIYQLGPVFRSGEAGRLHNPEFTLLEWYRLGFDDRALMAELAELVDLVLGAGVYERISYADVVRNGVRDVVRDGVRNVVRDVVREGVKNTISELSGGAERGPLAGHDPASEDAASAVRDALDLAFSDATAAMTGRRVFVVDYPADQAALARLRDGQAARFELIVDGVELANGYHEALDGAEILERFQEDQSRRRAAGRRVPEIDGRFLAAMDAGLPDCAGVALGVDRLLMHKLGVRNIADVMPFAFDRA